MLEILYHKRYFAKKEEEEALKFELHIITKFLSHVCNIFVAKILKIQILMHKEFKIP